MMNKSITKLFASSWTVLLLASATGHAWGPIAHYLITKKTAGEVVAQYANLPDAWEPNSDPDYGLTIEVTDYFCWSHCVRRTGVVDLSFNPIEIPKVPDYHTNVANIEPGVVMLSLLNGKVNLASRWGNDASIIGSHLDMASRGFSSHNTEDKKVHWNYFLGADGTELSNTDAMGKWTIHHGLKEHWAEYVFLATQVLDKANLERSDFTDDGHIIFTQEKPAPELAIEDLNKNNYENDKMNSLVWLLRLAQAVYNKNRTRRSTIDNTQYGLSVQSLADIKKLIKKQDIKLRNYFSTSHWADWEALNFNFQPGELDIETLAGETETVEYDTPDNLWAEWQMMIYLQKNIYAGMWNRNELHQLAGFSAPVQ